MPSKQRQKRIKQTQAEYEQVVHDVSQEKQVQSLEDSELFSIDRTASKAGKKKVEKELKPKESKTYLGPTEKALIDKVLKKRARAEEEGESILDFAGRKYGDRYVDIVPRGKRTTTTARGKVELALDDLWGEAIGEKDVPLTATMTKTPFHDPELSTAVSVASAVPKYRRKELKAKDKELKERKNKRNVKVALPGQSYHPAPADHQNALAEALAIEMKTQEAIENNKREKFFGDQKQIAALLLDELKDSDEEDEEKDLLVIDDNDSAIDENTEKQVRKAKKALTKAERNKKRARKFAEHEELIIRRDAQLLKSIDKIDKIKKQNKEEAEKQQKAKKAKEAMKKQAEEERRKGLSEHEVAAIPLSDELSGSLRALIPKGIALVDRTCQLEEKGDVFKKNRRAARKIENPHGARRVTWIPKYKAGVM